MCEDSRLFEQCDEKMGVHGTAHLRLDVTKNGLVVRLKRCRNCASNSVDVEVRQD